MKKIYPVQRINLVELREWKPYDPTGPISHEIADASYSTLDNASATDIGYYAELFLEKGKKKKVHLTQEQRTALYQAFKSNDDRIETFRILMRDTASWAWEAAVLPSEGDLDKALQAAVANVPYQMGWILGENLSEIMDAMGYVAQANFLAAILEAANIYIEQKKGHYDRFLIYDPGSSDLVKKIAQHPTHGQEHGVLDWSPASKIDPEVVKELVTLFDELKETLIYLLFKKLGENRQQINYEDRYHFMPMMNTVLKTHPEVPGAIKELREFLQGSPSMGANPFMNAPRARRLMKDFEEMKDLAEHSPILEFETHGDPPDQYLLRFHGLGLDPDGGTRNLHEVRIELGSEYPRSMPHIRWLTPILHPNIASGTACFGNFVMSPRVRLVDLVEIIWDMTRMALYSAGDNKTWQKLLKEYGFPVDPRTIRGEVPRVQDSGEGGPDLIIMGRY